MTKRTRVLLIDDNEMARRGLAAMLSTADWIQVAGEGDGCETGLELCRRLKPDVVMLDIRMPGADGLTCLDEIKRLDEPMAVLMVTLYDDRRYVLEAIRRGAAGYLLKDATTAEVVTTLRQVVDGQLAVDGRLLREAIIFQAEQPPPSDTVRDRAKAHALTPREHDVLVLVAEGMTNKEIGGQLSITEDTVKKHVQNIIWKLRAADRTQAAILAYRMGLIESEG